MLISQYIQGHGIQSNNLVKISGALGIEKRKTRFILQKGNKRNFDLAWTITGIYRGWVVSIVIFVAIIT
jgi:hypothetical protein